MPPTPLVETNQGSATPVKVVFERRIHPGADLAFKDWAERFVASAARSPGHEGGSVLSAANGLSFILLRFATHARLDEWQRSVTFARLMREAADVSASGGAAQIRSGMETWFTLPDMPAPGAPPPKWKMAVLTWACLLPMVIGLAYVFAPFGLPFLVEMALSTAIPVAMLTWIVMPRLTRLVYRWLYPSGKPVVASGHSVP